MMRTERDLPLLPLRAREPRGRGPACESGRACEPCKPGKPSIGLLVTLVVTSLLASVCVGISAAEAPPTFERDFQPLAAATEESGFGGTGRSAGPTGVGGTGRDGGPTGLGGTGRSDTESGLSGTGRSDGGSGIGGTGYVGSITGFGSIFVNGAEIEYGDDTPVTIDGAVAGIGDLATGQVVAVETGLIENRVVARGIEVLHEVSGPVSQVDPEQGRMLVLGQSVLLADGGDPALRALLADYSNGSWVAVSGLRRADGAVVATRIDPRPPSGPVSVSGLVSNAADGGFDIGSLHVETGSGGSGFPDSSQVVVRGTMRDGVLRADSVAARSLDPFAGRVESLSIEGFVSARPSASAISVSGWTVALGPQAGLQGGAAKALAVGARVAVQGRLSAPGRLEAGSVSVIRARPTLLPLTPGASGQAAMQEAGSTAGAPSAGNARPPGDASADNPRPGNGAPPGEGDQGPQGRVEPGAPPPGGGRHDRASPPPPGVARPPRPPAPPHAVRPPQPVHPFRPQPPPAPPH